MMRSCLHALQLRFAYVLGGLPQSALRRPNRITGRPREFAAARDKHERTIRCVAARGEALGDDLDAIAGTSLDKSETWARNPPSPLYVFLAGYSLTPLPGASWAFFCE